MNRVNSAATDVTGRARVAALAAAEQRLSALSYGRMAVTLTLNLRCFHGWAQEWTGFERWQLSWLDGAQVLCVPSGTTLAHLALLVGTGSQKLLLTPVSSTKAIAVESRRARGYDAQLTQPGLLVSLVDTQISTGSGAMRVLPEDDADVSKLTRTLKPGGSISHLGVTVTFVSSVGEQELVRIQR